MPLATVAGSYDQGMPAARELSSVTMVVDAFQETREESDELLAARMRTSPEGAFTILFTDVAGSTSLLERVGEEPWFRIMRAHNDLVRRLTEEHGGTVVKSQGDGFMLVFTSARAGLLCATAVQKAFADGSAVGSDEPLRLRIGLHSGFVMEDASDFFGKSVVLAARIADHARGGEILVSDAVRRYTEHDPVFSFDDVGEMHFKGLNDPYRVHAVRSTQA
jgi:class 3 adenylate cyclase